jgi:5-hydroxyisourate hydrolase-like protein (transthyretin family)
VFLFCVLFATLHFYGGSSSGEVEFPWLREVAMAFHVITDEFDSHLPFLFLQGTQSGLSGRLTRFMI